MEMSMINNADPYRHKYIDTRVNCLNYDGLKL